MKIKIEKVSQLQYNFSGSNTDGSFTTAILSSFLISLPKKKKKKIP